MSDIIKELSESGIYSYGSPQLVKFEKQMERYFKREYERWHGNDELPEKYGVSSFSDLLLNFCHKKQEIF